MVSHFPGLAQPLQRKLQKQQFAYRYVATIEHIIQANILYNFLLLRASRRRRKYQNVLSLVQLYQGDHAKHNTTKTVSNQWINQWINKLCFFQQILVIVTDMFCFIILVPPTTTPHICKQTTFLFLQFGGGGVLPTLFCLSLLRMHMIF